MTIVYATQSGNAEKFAFQLSKEGKKYLINSKVINIESFENSLVESTEMIVFLVATYGEGDPTDSAVSFDKWLSEFSGSLPSLNFAVFSLGNKQYEKFCGFGRKLNQLLESLGANRVSYGEGDDDNNLEADFKAFKSNFFSDLISRFPKIVMQKQVAPVLCYRASPSTGEVSGEPIFSFNYEVSKAITSSSVNLSKKYSLAEDCKENDVFELKLDAGIYGTAANIGIHPRNSPYFCAQVAKHLGFKLDNVFTIETLADGEIGRYPSITSLRTLFYYYLDFRPSMEMMGIISRFNDGEWSKLAQDRELYNETIHKPCLTFLDILSMNPALKVPLDALLEFPKLQPRYYTISSSALVSKDCGLLYNLSTFSSKGKLNCGVCSGYMKDLKVGDTVYYHVKSSDFKIPTVTVNGALPPIIMIGPGTGFAPFKAYIDELLFLQSNGTKLHQSNFLFYGCKTSKHWIYQDLMEEADKKGIKLVTAFSRDQDHKIYVQHRISEHSKLLTSLILNDDARIFVCGINIISLLRL